VAGISYSTYAPSSWFNDSYVQGGGSFTGYEQVILPNQITYGISYMHLVSTNANPPFTSDGQPLFSGAGTGYFESVINGTGGVVNYNITSMTAVVPEADSSVLLLAGLAALGLLATSRRKSLISAV